MGCILYIMLKAQMPFDDTNVTKMLKFQQNRMICYTIYYEMNISSELKKLLTCVCYFIRLFQFTETKKKHIHSSHLLEPDVEKRATILQVAVSKWLMNNTQKYSEWGAKY